MPTEPPDHGTADLRMPLHRIRAAQLNVPDQSATTADPSLSAEALHLEVGRTMLNRRSGHASAVLVAQGRVKLGVEDDDATLLAGEGVLLERGAIYSLQAVETSVVMVFSLAADVGLSAGAEAPPAP